ncbi:MAG: serine hydrolase domain-containing protein [Bryobacteraceae bacterium]|nr:serine hydrolase domain-containing protein [Bryobacteraceae bacterium]
MKKMIWPLLVVGLMAAPPVDTKKAAMDGTRLARIPERMKSYTDRGEVAGVVTLVARRGVVAALDAVGWADVENRKPMRTDSIFQIMSMTKPFTGTAVMMMVEEGKLALTDAVEKHLPEFRGQMMISSRAEGRLTLRKPARPITIRDLMTHTSGMGNMPPPGIGELLQTMDRPLEEAVALYAQQPLEFEPGSEWKYSNPGLATLGRLVEVASGMPFEKFLEARIFRPLGMKDSFIFPPADKIDRIAIVHQARNGKLETAPATILAGDPRRYRKGAVYSGPEYGMYSTASDLFAFYECLRTGGKPLLSKAAVEVMTSLHTGNIRAGHLPGTGFGLTWEVTKEAMGTLGLMSIGSFGHGGAFGTHGWVDPKKEMVGVFLVQHVGATNAKAVFMGMAGAAVSE